MTTELCKIAKELWARTRPIPHSPGTPINGSPSTMLDMLAAGIHDSYRWTALTDTEKTLLITGELPENFVRKD